jgi:hypothetical protein
MLSIFNFQLKASEDQRQSLFADNIATQMNINTLIINNTIYTSLQNDDLTKLKHLARFHKYSVVSVSHSTPKKQKSKNEDKYPAKYRILSAILRDEETGKIKYRSFDGMAVISFGIPIAMYIPYGGIDILHKDTRYGVELIYEGVNRVNGYKFNYFGVAEGNHVFFSVLQPLLPTMKDVQNVLVPEQQTALQVL